MRNRLTKAQALQMFREDILPLIKNIEYNGVDSIMRREEWNDYTDRLCKEGAITNRQYNNWSNPF
jgi:hypothetical protein